MRTFIALLVTPSLASVAVAMTFATGIAMGGVFVNEPLGNCGVPKIHIESSKVGSHRGQANRFAHLESKLSSQKFVVYEVIDQHSVDKHGRHNVATDNHSLAGSEDEFVAVMLDNSRLNLALLTLEQERKTSFDGGSGKKHGAAQLSSDNLDAPSSSPSTDLNVAEQINGSSAEPGSQSSLSSDGKSKQSGEQEQTAGGGSGAGGGGSNGVAVSSDSERNGAADDEATGSNSAGNNSANSDSATSTNSSTGNDSGNQENDSSTNLPGESMSQLPFPTDSESWTSELDAPLPSPATLESVQFPTTPTPTDMNADGNTTPAATFPLNVSLMSIGPNYDAVVHAPEAATLASWALGGLAIAICSAISKRRQIVSNE